MPDARYRQLLRRVDQSIDARVQAVKLGLRPRPGLTGGSPAKALGSLGNSLSSSGGGSPGRAAGAAAAEPVPAGAAASGLDCRLVALQEERDAAAGARLAAVRQRQALLQAAVRGERR
jgi:hypothetical protein